MPSTAASGSAARSRATAHSNSTAFGSTSVTRPSRRQPLATISVTVPAPAPGSINPRESQPGQAIAWPHAISEKLPVGRQAQPNKLS